MGPHLTTGGAAFAPLPLPLSPGGCGAAVAVPVPSVASAGWSAGDPVPASASTFFLAIDVPSFRVAHLAVASVEPVEVPPARAEVPPGRGQASLPAFLLREHVAAGVRAGDSH